MEERYEYYEQQEETNEVVGLGFHLDSRTSSSSPQATQKTTSFDPTRTTSWTRPKTAYPLSSGTETSHQQQPESAPNDVDVTHSVPTSTDGTNITAANLDDDLVQEGKTRALAALARIQQNKPSAQPRPSSTPLAYSNNSSIAQKRRLGLAKEEARKRAAWQRNWQYLANKVHAQEIQQLEQQAAQLEHHQQQQATLRNLQKQQQQHKPSNNNNTVALYVSGLVGKDCQVDILRPLFQQQQQSEGWILHKVHVYRHKETGQPKGDALIVYRGSDSVTEPWISAVCRQVRMKERTLGGRTTEEEKGSKTLLLLLTHTLLTELVVAL